VKEEREGLRERGKRGIIKMKEVEEEQ